MKQKKQFLSFIFLCFLGLSSLFAQYDFMHGAQFGNFMFSAPNLVERWGGSYVLDPDGWNRWHYEVLNSGTYSIEHEHGIPFINFYWDNAPKERFLMLINEMLMVLYSDNTMPVSTAIGGPLLDGLRFEGPGNIGGITASSTLRENNMVYSATPERLGLHINRVWAVEGGVGEKLYIDIDYGSSRILNISIGYVHFSRPYLFQYNSRPKRIRISTIGDRTNYIEHEFRDTPNFQTIDIGGLSDNIQIEVLEIFPGTRYNHMSINSILDWYSSF